MWGKRNQADERHNKDYSIMDELIEIKDVGTEFDNLVDPLIGLLFPEQAAVASVAHAALKIPGTIRDYRLYQKFGKFITVIREQDLGDSVKFSSQLFGDENTARENALRLVQYIDKAETLTVVGYMVNASRAVGNQLISVADYFRITWALTNTFPEDLHYFKTIATSEDVLQGNTQIIALAQSGLMISAGTDANRSVEDQDYAVTSFGILVDRYALSYEDEERQQYWKRREEKDTKIGFNATTVEWEPIGGSKIDKMLVFKNGQ